MYVYDFGQLGQAAIATTVVGGVKQLSPQASQLIQTLLTNKYPYPTSSFSIKTGTAMPAAQDPNADIWSYYAANTSAEAGNIQQTVYDQLQSLMDKGLFLVDLNSAQGAIAGSPNPLVYAIARDQNAVQYAAGPSSSFARLVPQGGAAQPGAPAPKKSSNAVPIVAGVGLATLLLILASAA